MPTDPARRAVFEVQLARLQDRKDRKEEAGKNAAATPPQDKASEKSGEASVEAPAMAANAAPEAASAAAESPATSGSMTDANGATNSAARNPALNSSAAGSDNTMATAARQSRRARKKSRRGAKRHSTPISNSSDCRAFLPISVSRKILSMSPTEQVAFADSLRGGKGQEVLEGLTPKQKETLLAHE